MGAFVAVALACAHYSELHRTRKPLLFFQACSYCGRAPDNGQQAAQCVSCGAPLKESQISGDDFFAPALKERYLGPERRL